MTIKEYMKAVDEFRCPGEPESLIVYIKKDNCIFNQEDMSDLEIMDKVILNLFHKAIMCDNFENGNWLEEVTYKPIQEIVQQTSEDYYIDTEMMNFIFSLKVAINETRLDSNKEFLLVYDGVGGFMYYAEGKDEIEQFLEDAETEYQDD